MRKKKLTSNDYARVLSAVKRFYPEEQWDALDSDKGFLEFSINVYLEMQHKLPPLLEALMRKHYPVFEKETRPEVLKYLDNVNKCIPVFCFDIFNLLKDDKTGVDFHDKYPDLEVWRSLNVRPKKVQTLDASDRKFYEDLSDADWEVLKAEEEQAMRLYNEWSHRRQFEFIELVQGMLLGLCPQLLDMEADAWVVYAMVLADQYDKWKCCCEHIEIFIDYGFSSDILALPSEQYDEICYRRFVELMDTPVMQLRGRRIAGERV